MGKGGCVQQRQNGKGKTCITLSQAEWEREDLYNRDTMGKGGCVQQRQNGEGKIEAERESEACITKADIIQGRCV